MLMQIANRKIYYEITGKGPAIVFFHGFGGNHVVWAGQVPYLVQHGYQTITFDLAGHGKSRGSAISNMVELADEAAALITNLDLKSIILIGHSMGAGLVWAILKYHPELNIVKVVTIDQTPKMLNDEEWHYGWAHDQIELTQDNFKNVLSYYDHIKETLNGIDDQVWSKLYPFKQKYPFEREKNMPLLFDHVQKDWRPTVYGIRIPALSISSTKSPYFKIGYVTEMQKHNKNIEINTVDDAGHDIMAEKPAEFNHLLGKFLGIE